MPTQTTDLSTVNALVPNNSGRRFRAGCSWGILCVFLLHFTPVFAAQPIRWQSGMLVFQSLECGPLCAAIQSVTQSYQNQGFNHAGMVWKQNDSLFVIEAIGKRVTRTPLNEFLNRKTNGKPSTVWVGIPRPAFQKMFEAAARESLHFLNVPYDDRYLPGAEELYCTELIYYAFQRIDSVKQPWKMEPMTFIRKGTSEIDAGWKAYYQQWNMEVPEGKPGCNPGKFSRNQSIRMYPVHRFVF